MPVSQNGSSANDRSVIASYAVPGGKVSLRKGDVSVILIYVATRWHTDVEPLNWPGIWGYAERPIRGSVKTLSNHASGTALDANAPAHPLGADPKKTFGASKIAKLQAILDDCDGVVRWGGAYTSRKDGMHVEIVKGAGACQALADKIRAELAFPGTTKAGNKGSAATKAFQRRLNQRGFTCAIDGDHGPATSAVLIRFQNAKGLKGDGVGGPASWAALWV